MRLILSALLLVVLTGCGAYFLASSKKGFEASQLKAAAFDLQCPVDEVTVTELSEGSVNTASPAESEGTVIGVSGCEKQATYKYFNKLGWIAQTAR